MSSGGNFKHLSDLPKRSNTHYLEGQSQTVFESFVALSDEVFIQKSDRKDYGTDYQLEVCDDGRSTNVRLHVQLKGTRKKANSDGSVSVEIDRANLNYLLMYPYSFYVCYHHPSARLLVCSAEEVARTYQHGKRNWTSQTTLTVPFSKELSLEWLSKVAVMARLDATNSRDRRFEQVTASKQTIVATLSSNLPALYVPEDQNQAAQLLSTLYESDKEEFISSAFQSFLSVLGAEHDAMIFCYMAEINLGMSLKDVNHQRVMAGISYFTSRIGRGLFSDASLHYCIGNAHTVLGDHQLAIQAYDNALASLSGQDDNELAAQCHKNRGASLSHVGEIDQAIGSYHQALKINTQLAEAHHALGCHYYGLGNFRDALHHFDSVVFTDGRSIKQLSVVGWRINIHFNLGDAKSAFRDINNLLGQAAKEVWVWPWCARQVAEFGRMSVEVGILSIGFWDRYIKAFPKDIAGERERSLTLLFLQSSGQDMGTTFQQFKSNFDAFTKSMNDEAAAYAWDRLGHWAQDHGNCEDAVICFRNAYDLAGGEYGYCLGAALNRLGRGAEGLDILKEQAKSIQPDHFSWYQLALAYEQVGRVRDSIKAYRKSIALNRGYEPAWFDLGGLYWNQGNPAEARRIWAKAIELFPEHELVESVRRIQEFPW